MELMVIGSSSRGNCYVLRSADGEMLMVEAGVRWDKVKQALDYNLRGIMGCLVSHEHGDHARSVADVMACNITCLMSQGTKHALHLSDRYYAHGMLPMQRTNVGSFVVMPFPVEHDAKEPFGWLIKHPECGTVVFATDTYFLQYRFEHVANWLIECNYRMDLLEQNYKAGLIDHKRYERTLKSHMSYEQCRDTLLANDLSQTNHIVLIHMSDANSNARDFVQGLHAATGKHVVAARPGLTMDFGRAPF